MRSQRAAQNGCGIQLWLHKGSLASPQALLDPVNSMSPTYGLCVRLFTAPDDFASLCLCLPALLVRLAVGFPSLPLGPAAVKRQEKGEMKQPGFGIPPHRGPAALLVLVGQNKQRAHYTHKSWLDS